MLPAAPPGSEDAGSKLDAAAGLRMWGYETTIPGVLDDEGDLFVFTIPPLPAADWIIASTDARHLAYLPGLLTEDSAERLMQAIEDGEVSITDLEAINHEAMEVVSGWRWWEAGRLIAAVTASYQTMGGLLLISGADPARMPLGAYLAAVYARIWIDHDTKGRARLAQQVAVPPPSMLNPNDPDGGFDEEAAEAAVRAFIAAGPTGHRDQ